MIPIKKCAEQKVFHIDDKITTDQLGRLVSYTQQLSNKEKITPLEFFNQSRVTEKNRTFWAEPQAKFYMVGVGSAYEIEASTNRFQTTEAAWDKLLKNALIFNEFHQAGTGLVAIGGMSFDPKRTTDKRWEKFAHSQLSVPEVLLTESLEAQFITVNVFLEEKHLGQTLHTIFKEKKQFLQQSSVMNEPNAQIIKKDEQAVTEWKASVQKAIDEINNEQAEKIVLARELRITLNRSPHLGTVLQGLLHTQTTSYIFAIERGENCFVGATPERLVRVEEDDLLSTCLAGTAPRGTTDTSDEKLRVGLFNDAKNRLEHNHVVQMIREAITPYCTHMNIPETPTVKTLKNLHHLYTPVTATLNENYSIFNIVEALHPTPALGGVPYEKSLAFIRDHESFDRGWFGAPVGWLDSQRNGEFAVAIRSGLIQQNIASLFAGCGVMGDSNIDEEYEETGIKFLPMLNVLEGNYDVS